MIKYTKERDDLRSEQYNQLSQKYHELEALLKRWNEIAQELSNRIECELELFLQTPKLQTLISDTNEAIK